MKTTLRHSFSMSLAVLLALAVIQPFGIDTMDKGRFPYLILVGIFTFVSAIITMPLASWLNKLIYKDPESHPYLCTLSTFILNIPVLSFFISLANVFQHKIPLTLHMYMTLTLYVASLSLFLYIWSCLKLKNQTLEKTLDDVRAVNLLLEKRQEELAAKLEQKEESAQNKLILKGQTSSSALEVSADAIVYIESIANYADICYMDSDEIRHKTLRITLKGVKESLGDCPSLVQCHRAFIVNLDFVVAMEKVQSAYQLQLFGMDKRIPVSRSNGAALRERLS